MNLESFWESITSFFKTLFESIGNFFSGLFGGDES